jgi:AcrR family transcriptional regulator
LTERSATPARRRRKEARPGEIIEAGLAEFAARGFEAARMADVAARAGVSNGTVFRYFPTKEALFEAAVRSRASPVFSDASIGPLPEGPVLPLLKALIRHVHDNLADPKLLGLIRVIIAEGPRFPALLEIYHRESISRAHELLGRLIARGVASGELRDDGVAALPMVLMSPALMAAVWRMTFNAVEPLPIERFRDAHLALLAALGR